MVYQRQACNAILTAAAAGLFLVMPLRAQTPLERLAAYEAAVSTGDPAAAAAFLSDGEVLTLAESDFARAAALKAKAAALKDLAELLAMPWGSAKANKLSQALSIRIDAGKPLCGLGIGPEPEKLLAWLAQYQPKFPAAKTAVVRKAIRQWDVVFGTMTDTYRLSWGQARQFENMGVTVARGQWAAWTIRERNAIIAQLMAKDPDFAIYDDEELASDKESMSLLTTVDAIKKSGALSAPQLAELSGKSFVDQVYLLGNLFDKSNIAVDADLKARIHAARYSLPKTEVLPSQQRALLGGMLATAIPAELSGTRAGDRVLGFYGGSGPLKIELRPCDGNYSRFDAATGAIALDSETIQQYMRLKGYTAASVMASKKQVAEIAKYMSPMVVYEAAHHMQYAWAKGNGVYKPHVQEDEIEAMALEGLYTSEKVMRDAAFNQLFTDLRAYSSYASKRVAIATKYEMFGSKAFAVTVRQLYFSGLPSLNAASAQVLGAVSGELARRAGLTAQERSGLDASGLTLAEAMEMSPEELAGSVGEIRSAALEKIQKDLSDLAVYQKRYKAAENGGRGALKLLKSGSIVKQSSGPPAL